MGAIYNTEVETPRFDAGSGLVLISDQKKGYYSKQALNTEFYINGNSKSIEIIENEIGDDLAIVGFNNDSLSVFKIYDQP